jgi:hypothetical protein
MAHYAFLDENNIVTEVIAGIDETEEIESLNPEIWYAQFRNQKCVRTSYSSSIRFNYAGIGYSYDPIDDAFIAPMPECGHETLTLNDAKRWECSACADYIKQRMASIKE